MNFPILYIGIYWKSGVVEKLKASKVKIDDIFLQVLKNIKQKSFFWLNNKLKIFSC